MHINGLSQRCCLREKRLVQVLGSFFSSTTSNLHASSRSVSSSSNTTTTSKRRRFQSVYDSNPDWRDWFIPEEYENPWDRSSTRFEHVVEFGPADCATRHIIYTLQNFHRYENVTTGHCNVTLQNILDLTKGEPAFAERARAILENMEFLVDNSPALRRNLQKIPRPVPKPDRTTYNLVLRILAETRGTIEIPEQARAIVERMEKRFEIHQDIEMKPNPFHWNCVLIAYKHCDHGQRAVYALKLLLEHHDKMDPSSYIHLLHICALAENRENPEAAQLGANVAIRLFQETFEKNQTSVPISMLPSHFYAFFLQAIRPLEQGSRLRDHYFDNCFALACQEGKVNRFILKDFVLHVKSGKVFDRHLGQYRKDIVGHKVDESVQKLLSMLPSAWTENAN